MNSILKQTDEHHILLLSYYEMKIVLLESRLTTFGRDPRKDITVECDNISREHATFLRVPSPQEGSYEFRIIDGGPNKNRSKNGIAINGKSSFLHRLEHGDFICFSNSVQGLYLKVDLEYGDFKTYINILKQAKDLSERTRNKILLMTRVFDKVTCYLTGEEMTVTVTPMD